MLELVFVIVVIGIIGKFGLEFIAQAYKHFIFSNINHSLQAKSTTAIEQISSRLRYRIKKSVIISVSKQPITAGERHHNGYVWKCSCVWISKLFLQ